MVKNNGLLRIFWPNTLARTTTSGVIVGWRNSELDLCVITILEDVEVRTLVCLGKIWIDSIGTKCRGGTANGHTLPKQPLPCGPHISTLRPIKHACAGNRKSPESTLCF